MRSFILPALVLSIPALAFPNMMGGSMSRRAIDKDGCVLPGSYKERAAPYASEYPYTGAKLDGKPGPGKGLTQVPAPGDDAHRFEHPSIGAFRGPCPGLNAPANHGFLSRDGVTNFEELVAMMQNVYNIGYDLAVTLTTFGVAADGDMDLNLMSLGGNATCATRAYGGGLNWHLRFEGDTSLTRNDYNLADGDNYSFNGTLYKQMTDTVAKTSSSKTPLYDQKGLSLYRANRYEQSKAENPSFYWGPKALVLYGGASFLYQLFPSWGTQPDQDQIGTFFGAIPNNEGTYDFTAERIPENWVNRPTTYTLYDMAEEMNNMFYDYPKLFGGNNGAGNFTPDALQLPKEKGTVSEFMCFLYDYVTDKTNPQPVLTPQSLKYITTHINPVWQQFNCDWVVAP